MKKNQAIGKALGELKNILKVEFSLYDAQGQLVVTTRQDKKPESEEVQSAVSLFLESQAESQKIGGTHYFKVNVKDEDDYALLVENAGEDSHQIGRIAVCQVENLLLAYKDKQDLNNFMQNLLLDNLLLIDIHNRAKQLKIEVDACRAVFVIETIEESDNGAMEIVRGLLDSKDFMTTVDNHTIILIKALAPEDAEAQMENVAHTLLDMLNAEAMSKVRIGYGNAVGTLADVSKAYKEAKMALEVSSIFYGKQPIASYNTLGIGRIIYQLPLHLCEMFIDEIFGGELPAEIDAEALNTIQKFFENNLNVSETSRQLYVHRNTLVYRLEKIEKVTGLDIRTFEDAMTFRLALMVIDYMKYLEHKGKE